MPFLQSGCLAWWGVFCCVTWWLYVHSWGPRGAAIRGSAERGSLGCCTTRWASRWYSVYPAWVWSRLIRPSLCCINRPFYPVQKQQPKKDVSFVPLLGPCCRSSTNVTTSPFPMMSARGEGGKETKMHQLNVFPATWISNVINISIVQDSTQCPTPPASLMATCGPCI